MEGPKLIPSETAIGFSLELRVPIPGMDAWKGIGRIGIVDIEDLVGESS
jgi:hypothetical protein